jgi:acyl-CoA synthetase (AMP-forming)/AMP-acid ligase II
MEVVESILAIWRIGAILVPLSFRLSPNELVYILDHSEVSTIIFQDIYEEIVRKIRSSVINVTKFLFSGKNPPQDFIDFDTESKKQSVQTPEVKVKENDIATILYTAGTTGKPKGVVATHANWVWSSVNYLAASSKGNFQHDKRLTVFPLFHTGALCGLCAGIYAGATKIFLEKFDPLRILETIEKEKITRLGNPPTAYKMILRVPNIEKYDLSSVEFLQSGSEMMPDETRNQLKKLFPGAGIVENYGMTETCGAISTRREVFTDSKPFSVGLPHPFMRVRVVDKQNKDVAPGEVGEIIVSGPNVMKEYYKNPEKTAEAIRDGWLHTEDIGKFDEDGFLYIIERKHHMIISGGENIYPKEIEEVLYRHPKIIEVAVFGLPDQYLGYLMRSGEKRFVLR